MVFCLLNGFCGWDGNEFCLLDLLEINLLKFKTFLAFAGKFWWVGMSFMHVFNGFSSSASIKSSLIVLINVTHALEAQFLYKMALKRIKCAWKPLHNFFNLLPYIQLIIKVKKMMKKVSKAREIDFIKIYHDTAIKHEIKLKN